MLCIRVIGVGNDARGDDAVGLEVARRLQQDAPAGITVEALQGGGISLLDCLQGTAAVIVIDACYSGATPGSIHRLEPLTQPIPKTLYLCSTHAFGLGEVIELARALQQLPSRLVVYGIEGRQFDIGAELSADVQRVVPDVLRRVHQDIAAWQTPIAGEHDHA